MFALSEIRECRVSDILYKKEKEANRNAQNNKLKKILNRVRATFLQFPPILIGDHELNTFIIAEKFFGGNLIVDRTRIVWKRKN